MNNEERAYIEKMIADLVRQRDEARAECDALRKDEERLNWLDNNPREATIRLAGDFRMCVFYGLSCDPKWSAREAIDAAMKEKP